jgi:hypothetical protein
VEMGRLEGPLIFNKEDWGLGNEELRETYVQPPRGAASKHLVHAA